MAASLKRGIDWIASEDEPTDLDAVNVSGYISTLLLAYLFDRPELTLAREIVKNRRAQDWIDDDFCHCSDGGHRVRPGGRCMCGGIIR